MANDNFILPPPPTIGQRHAPGAEAQVISYVNGLMWEAYEMRQKYDAQADLNVNGHEGRTRHASPRNGVTTIEINRVRNVDIAHVQVQTETSPRIRLNARESGEPAPAYLDLRVDVGLLDGPAMAVLASLTPGPDGKPLALVADADGKQQPLTDDDRAKVEMAIAQGLLPPEILVEASDRTKAEAEQIVFDALWERSNTDFYVAESLFRSTIIGWQLPLYGFDDAAKKHALFNFSHLQVFVDSTVTDIGDAAHAETMQFMDLRKAVAKWPFARAALEKSAIPGGSSGAAINTDFPFRVPEAYQKAFFRRAMVPVIHCWIRWYPFPVVEVNGQVVLEPVSSPDGSPAMNDDGTPKMQQQTRPGIREICIAGNTVVSDRETEFGNIPLPHFVNEPIVDSPYGQGVPESLEPLQKALNSLLTDLVTYFHYFGTPGVGMPVSVAGKIPGFAEDVYRAPYGEIWEIPDDLWTRFNGELVKFFAPPPIPADMWRFLDILLNLIEKEGQVSETLEGEGKANWSGDAIARLQEAARGLIAWKSRRTEMALKYLAQLMRHSIRTRLTVQDLTQLCGKYPACIWHAAREKPADIDVSVEIASGGGQVRAQARQDAITLWANGQGPYSETSLLEDFEKDPKTERNNKIKEMEDKAKTPVPPVAGAPVPGAAPVDVPPAPTPSSPFPAGPAAAAA